MRSKGVRRVAGEMNKTEAAYAHELELQRRAGMIQWFAFEGVTLKIAHDCRYTPDFLVMMADDTLEAREVKGFWRDDARVKIKVAAAKFPFKFSAITKSKGGWQVEEF
jgi:hypothetical protein